MWRTERFTGRLEYCCKPRIATVETVQKKRRSTFGRVAPYLIMVPSSCCRISKNRQNQPSPCAGNEQEVQYSPHSIQQATLRSKATQHRQKMYIRIASKLVQLLVPITVFLYQVPHIVPFVRQHMIKSTQVHRTTRSAADRGHAARREERKGIDNFRREALEACMVSSVQVLKRQNGGR